MILLSLEVLAKRSEFTVLPFSNVNRSNWATPMAIKSKSLTFRLGTGSLKSPQTRYGELEPQRLTHGLRSDHSPMLAIAEMYAQSVSTRRVKKTVKALCGMDL